MQQAYFHDVVIIGSGAAGLSLALRLAQQNLTIALLCKGPLTEGSSLYAQGGVAAVMSDDDSLEAHINDTLIAGDGLCDQTTVAYTVNHARECIDWLVTQGVTFSHETKPDGTRDYHLGREGGHSHRRILHADDATGRAVITTLVDLVRQQKTVSIFEYYTALDLIKQQQRCVGVYAYHEQEQQVRVFHGRFTILATGGASKVYLYTSNPDVASGDGIAMAWRAGCRVANMEFNQFHPTCLYHPKARSFLITEAMRGEGAYLTLPNGKRFMDEYDKRGELAPRDIVARAIDHQIKRLGIDFVYLDITHRSADFIISHFPNIYRNCLQFGLDITKEPIPVVPAAHYTCGGVITDHAGRTDLASLYAIGEVACTGLHGANRMASNSLLECLVFAASASENILQNLHDVHMPSLAAAWDESQVTDSDEEIVVTHNWHELRRLMWNYVGIVRTNKRLQRAANRIALLKQEIHDYYSHFRVNKNLIELRNLVLVADLIIRCALQRHESRGLHYNLDYPQKLSTAQDTILHP